ncbi:GH1 family beta-glucosidase [Streptomyces sp. NPDC056405]|uniref:GH1 family beta-glucosidase n=1 Tax=Streptomyces sp. NPDC056405 TaxID=3345811 RepID=UPI0035D907D1
MRPLEVPAYLESRLATAFPPSFLWGAATSAYQIEGAVAEGGRTASIWDTFCRQPGAIASDHDGDVACDHYHRMPEDVDLMASLGIDAYRFSLAWPRIQPHGSGGVNQKGLDFYKRLIDRLNDRGIKPWITLYHWDLPQELEDAGGWPLRDTAYRFAEYAELAYGALGDRVEHWTTLNEPWCSAMLGYDAGVHAPGRKNFRDAIRAAHHLLLGHGLAARRIREAAGSSPLQLGITLNLGTATPQTDSAADRDACRRVDGLNRRLYLDPIVHGRYPEDVVSDLERRNADLPIEDGDLSVIASPLDMLGVNFYFGTTISGVGSDGSMTDSAGVPIAREVGRGLSKTALGWEITPTSLTDLLLRLQQEYGLPTVITENGAAFDDVLSVNGAVHDQDRVSYIAEHVTAVAAARAQGADVRGYFVWSLMDNFEWAHGFGKRFGIIHVDYETQRRTLKDSALWYRDTLEWLRAPSSG